MIRLGLLGAPTAFRSRTALMLAAATLLSAACTHNDATFVQGGDVARGKHLIEATGCAACHEIGGIRGPRGEVGPPLNGIARRAFIAGELTNTPDNMARWIQDPQAVEPNTAMPNLGLDERAARDIAAYLYTLR